MYNRQRKTNWVSEILKPKKMETLCRGVAVEVQKARKQEVQKARKQGQGKLKGLVF